MKTSTKQFVLFALAIGFIGTGQAEAAPLPTGGSVIRGDASIKQDSDKLTIQSSQRSVIEWGEFNIDSGKLVEFLNQKAVLNYVLPSGGKSIINGTLKATDSLILINPQGISVRSGATLNVTSLLLSTGTLSSNAIDDFINGANYTNGNAPLISIDLTDGSGPINIDGKIQSTNSGDIAIISPNITFGPNAVIETVGQRDSNTTTDGVNVLFNGVIPEGSLWIGTTGLPSNSYTANPGLPTGLGFVNISGQPSPQDISIDLAGVYDLERFVIGTTGSKANQFDSLFFSPNFRAHDFYVYDGGIAIAEAHRQSTNGGPLERKLQHLISKDGSNTTPIVKLESDILGLHLPAGSQLIDAKNIHIDAQTHKIDSGTLTLSPGAKAISNKNFTDQFGSGNIVITFNGQASTLTGSNGATASYNVDSGNVSWTKTVTGPPTTEVVLQPGSAVQITQGATNPPFVPPSGGGSQGSYTIKEGGWYRGNSGARYYGSTPAGCNRCHYVGPNKGNVVYWKGHFISNPSGRTQFVTGGAGSQPATHVVYQINQQWYVTSAANFNPDNAPKPNQLTSITASTYHTVQRPGPTTEQQFNQMIPISGSIRPPQGAVTSHWERPVVVKPLPAVSFTGYGPVNQGTGTGTPPNPGTGSTPGNTPVVVKPIPQPSFTGYGPVNQGTGTGTPPNTGTGSTPGNTPVVVKPILPRTITGSGTTDSDSGTSSTNTNGQNPTNVMQAENKTNNQMVPETRPAFNEAISTRQSGANSENSQTNRNDISATPREVLLPRRKDIQTSLEYQIPQKIINQLGEDADLTQANLKLPDGSPLPAGIEFEPLSETITINQDSMIKLPLDVQLSAPTRNGVGKILFTIGAP